MGDVRNEPSMEDILASIKRIITEDGANATAAPRPRRGGPITADAPFQPEDAVVPQPAKEPIEPAAQDAEEEVLELTQSIEPTADASTQAQAEAPAADPRLVSETAVSASRQALAALSAMIVKPENPADNTLDGLVREMLRPMLKEWLDSRLPELVEQLVEKEIARITGRAF